MKKYNRRKTKNKGNLFVIIALIYVLTMYLHMKEDLLLFPIAILLIIIVGPKLFAEIKKCIRKRNYLNSSLYKVDKMTGTEFEQFLKFHFQNIGYNALHIGQTGDFGADLILKKGGIKTVVQAKRYNAKVGVAAIQQVISAKEYYRCQKAMVVTNNYFTSAAKEMANKCNVELWDREQIKKKFKK